MIFTKGYCGCDERFYDCLKKLETQIADDTGKVENCFIETFTFESSVYWVTQKLPKIYTANHATFPIRIRKITVQICGNFWVPQ